MPVVAISCGFKSHLPHQRNIGFLYKSSLLKRGLFFVLRMIEKYGGTIYLINTLGIDLLCPIGTEERIL